MKKLLSQMRPSAEKGQSLVEMAIITPILIFMLIGVFEVGWALRGYLVLTNVNREVTRFSIRPGYLSYSTKNNNPPTVTTPLTPAYTTVGYDRVLSYTFSTLADQLPLDFSTGQTSTMIISHMVVDTGVSCKDINDCDCNAFVTNPSYITGTKALTMDDLILHPQVSGYEYFYAAKFPPTSTYKTKYNYYQEAWQLARQNAKFNCELAKKSNSTLPSANNVIVTEIYYNQPQLFGFPLISNPVTDPVPMYAHTVMRMIVASRSGDNVDNVGPLCIALPLTIRYTQVATASQGQIFDVLGGYPDTTGLSDPPGTNDRGFLAWDPQWNNVNDLRGEFIYPRSSFNSYENARVSGDTSLNVGDWIASLPGNNGGSLSEIQYWVGKGPVIIPVWDDFSGETPPSTPAAFHIVTFIKVEIMDGPAPYNIDLTSNNPKVYARYVGIATECLP